MRNIEQVVRNPALLGWIGGATLFLSTDLVFVAIQSSLDKIFVPGKRSFLKSKILSIVLAVMVFIVVMSTIAVNAVDSSLANLEALTAMREASGGVELVPPIGAPPEEPATVSAAGPPSKGLIGTTVVNPFGCECSGWRARATRRAPS